MLRHQFFRPEISRLAQTRFGRASRGLLAVMLLLTLIAAPRLKAEDVQGEEKRMYRLVTHQETMNRVEKYVSVLRRGDTPGKRLQETLRHQTLETLTAEQALAGLVATKLPQIFAESAVVGDGSDWNLTELGILGDVSIVVPVQVFDNGRHSQPQVHAAPFAATLLFVPGALLRSGNGRTPADWEEVVVQGKIDDEAYCRLYERRLLPTLFYAHREAGRRNRKALVTIPGLGCGQFAGPFRGTLGRKLETALMRLVERHAKALSNIACLYYDPFNECENHRTVIDGIVFMTRPLLKGNESKPQLCHPSTYAEAGDDFANCDLFSVVAWDHVSWPGNDFYGGSRATDDGVKGAATDVMQAMTGVTGRYDVMKQAYLPPSPFRTWGEVVEQKRLALRVVGNLEVYSTTVP